MGLFYWAFAPFSNTTGSADHVLIVLSRQHHITSVLVCLHWPAVRFTLGYYRKLLSAVPLIIRCHQRGISACLLLQIFFYYSYTRYNLKVILVSSWNKYMHIHDPSVTVTTLLKEGKTFPFFDTNYQALPVFFFFHIKAHL